MPGIQRKGDPNSAGGVALGGVGSVQINGRPVVVVGTRVSPHSPWRNKKRHRPHAAPVTAGGVGTVRANGIPINVDGDVDTCGHPRVGGSSDVRIGG
jgi:uncharacterized Zn-binding protein involved in type VI secretion